MKLKQIFLSAIVLILAMSFTYKVEYKVDKQKSKLTWVGKKVTGEHNGNIEIASGSLTSNGKTVTGGVFEIDMNTITNSDLTGEYNQKLIGHLKSDDFFGTAKFPKAKLVINKVTLVENDQYKVNGNLTIKGITKDIEFPATIKTSGNQVTAKAKVVVDRTKYDIKYGSGSFFDNLGDKAIDNDFILNVDLVASK